MYKKKREIKGRDGGRIKRKERGEVEERMKKERGEKMGKGRGEYEKEISLHDQRVGANRFRRTARTIRL